MRKPYSGEWDGLTATMISRLMDCSDSTARRKLNKLKKELHREVKLKDIGRMIHEYMADKENSLDSILYSYTVSGGMYS